MFIMGLFSRRFGEYFPNGFNPPWLGNRWSEYVAYFLGTPNHYFYGKIPLFLWENPTTNPSYYPFLGAIHWFSQVMTKVNSAGGMEEAVF